MRFQPNDAALFARAIPYLRPLFPPMEQQIETAAKVQRYQVFLARATAAGVDPTVAKWTVLHSRHEDDPIAAAEMTLCLP